MESSLKVIKYKGRVVFQKFRVQSFTRLPKEYFENEACFVFVNQGSYIVRTQTERILFNKETALLSKCLNYFYETTKKNPNDDDNVEVVGLLFYPELIQDLFDFDIKNSNHTVDYNLKQIQVNQLLALYRESIDILIDHPELVDEHLVKNKLREFIILMTKTVKAPSELDFLASMFKPNFAKFEEVIQHNLYSDLHLGEFASLCHMSLSTFKRKFKEIYKESPARYISQMKIKKAITSLNNKELRISDIAYDLGYDSLTTFNRVFKDQTGKTPSEYRVS
jgi:AraC-like DNA-binding protein